MTKKYVYKVRTKGEPLGMPGGFIFSTYNLTAETAAQVAKEALEIDRHKNKSYTFSVLSVDRIGEDLSHNG